MPMDVGWADAVVGAGYKWLLSPRGVAWIALNSEVAETMMPLAPNWYAGRGDGQTTYGLPLRLRDDARRYDVSPAWFSHVGAAQALPWLASIDLTRVRNHCVAMANRLRDGVGLPVSDSAIVTVEGTDTAKLQRVGVTATTRAGSTRLLPFVYD